MLIIFDLDDTLIDTSGSITPIKLEEALHTIVAAGFQVPHFVEALEQLKRIDMAAESAREAIAEFLEIHNGDPKYYEMAVKEIYETFSSDLPIFTFDGVLETLKTLSEWHHLAIVTAGFFDYQHWKLKKTGIDSSLFSKIVVCEPEGKKRDYEKIVEELNFLPKDVIVCGDRVDKDLTPAKDLGFRTVRMKKGRGCKSLKSSRDVDYTINEFYEILEVVASASLVNFTPS